MRPSITDREALENAMENMQNQVDYDALMLQAQNALAVCDILSQKRKQDIIISSQWFQLPFWKFSLYDVPIDTIMSHLAEEYFSDSLPDVDMLQELLDFLWKNTPQFKKHQFLTSVMNFHPGSVYIAKQQNGEVVLDTENNCFIWDVYHEVVLDLSVTEETSFARIMKVQYFPVSVRKIIT